MLNKDQALIQVQSALPGVEVKACAVYRDFYLFRVEYPSLTESDWDPFFSVDVLTGEVRDFSVITDISAADFVNLEWKEV